MNLPLPTEYALRIQPGAKRHLYGYHEQKIIPLTHGMGYSAIHIYADQVVDFFVGRNITSPDIICRAIGASNNTLPYIAAFFLNEQIIQSKTFMQTTLEGISFC